MKIKKLGAVLLIKNELMILYLLGGGNRKNAPKKEL